MLLFIVLGIACTIGVIIIANDSIVKYIKYFNIHDMHDILNLIAFILCGFFISLIIMTFTWSLVYDIYDIKQGEQINTISLENSTVVITGNYVYYQEQEHEQLQRHNISLSKFSPYLGKPHIKVHKGYINSPFWTAIFGDHWDNYYDFYISEEYIP